MQFLAAADFAAQANSVYEVDLGASSMQLTLVDIRPLPANGFADAKRAPFSLILRSTVQVVLPQRIYRLRHAAGLVEMFIVPVGRDATGVTYEAIYN